MAAYRKRVLRELQQTYPVHVGQLERTRARGCGAAYLQRAQRHAKSRRRMPRLCDARIAALQAELKNTLGDAAQPLAEPPDCSVPPMPAFAACPAVGLRRRRYSRKRARSRKV